MDAEDRLRIAMQTSAAASNRRMVRDHAPKLRGDELAARLAEVANLRSGGLSLAQIITETRLTADVVRRLLRLAKASCASGVAPEPQKPKRGRGGQIVHR